MVTRSALILFLSSCLFWNCSKKNDETNLSNIDSLQPVLAITSANTYREWPLQDTANHFLWKNISIESGKSLPATWNASFDSIQGIFFAKEDSMGFGNVLQIAEHKGLPLISLLYEGHSPSLKSVIQNDYKLAGQMAAEYLSKHLPSEGKIAILRHSPHDLQAGESEKGFWEAGQKIISHLEILPELIYAGDSVNTAFHAAENLFLRNPDVSVIFSSTAIGTQGLLKALHDIDKAGKVLVLSVEGNAAVYEAVNAGEVHGLWEADYAMLITKGQQALSNTLFGNTPPRTIMIPMKFMESQVKAGN